MTSRVVAGAMTTADGSGTVAPVRIRRLAISGTGSLGGVADWLEPTRFIRGGIILLISLQMVGPTRSAVAKEPRQYPRSSSSMAAQPVAIFLMRGGSRAWRLLISELVRLSAATTQEPARAGSALGRVSSVDSPTRTASRRMAARLRMGLTFHRGLGAKPRPIVRQRDCGFPPA